MALLAPATTILTLAAIVCAGALLRAARLVRDGDQHVLNAVIIYIGLPAFIFRAVHKATLAPDLWRSVLVAWLVFGVLLGLALFAARALRLEPTRAGAFALAASLGNTGYIGYPVTLALLGSTALPYALFYDVFGTVFALVLIGMPLAARFGADSRVPRNVLRELATFPAVPALLVGLAMRGVQIWTPVSHGLELLANLVTPLVMLSVGIALKPALVAKSARPLALVGALKLLVGPLLAIGASALLMRAPGSGATVLEAGMPTMMLTYVVGERYGLDTDFIAAAIFVTTVASAITIPVVHLFA